MQPTVSDHTRLANSSSNYNMSPTAARHSVYRQVGRQGGLGFRAEVLIEDTHTSIDLFRQGWKSAYVNFPNVSEFVVNTNESY